MKCIFCKSSKTQVVNSRLQSVSNNVWRRRTCNNCDKTFTTTEQVDYSSFYIIKRNNTRKKFVFEKLFISIFLIIYEGKEADRGDASMLAKRITKEIIDLYFTSKVDKYLTSKQLMIFTYKSLSRYNKLWGMRYALYSDFRKSVLKAYIT